MHKINSKWAEDTNSRPDTYIKLSKENIGKTHFDINYSDIFLDPSPRIMGVKTKINKWGQIKRFLTLKKSTNKMKRQPTEWEKMFANNVTDKGLISKVYKQLMQLNIKIKKKLKKLEEDLNNHFCKDDTQMGKEEHQKMRNITSY